MNGVKEEVLVRFLGLNVVFHKFVMRVKVSLELMR